MTYFFVQFQTGQLHVTQTNESMNLSESDARGCETGKLYIYIIQRNL